MGISFSIVPASILQPLFYAEVSNSKAAGGTTSRPTLLIGQALGTGFTANVPARLFGLGTANTLYRPGSHLARMVKVYMDADPNAEIWCLPVADNGTTKAAKTITLVGTSTAAGTLNLYIAGQKLAISVATNKTASQIGDLIAAALGIDEAAAHALGSTYPVTAVNTSGAVALTARNAGTLGNQIDVRCNYLGDAASEFYPAGITITELPNGTYVSLTGGATDPTLTTAIANMGDKRFSYIGHGYGVSGSGLPVTLLKAEMADSTAGRWGPMRRVYGGCYSGIRGTATALAAITLPNDPHACFVGIEGTPTPPWELGAMYAARAAGSFRNDPARPLNTLELVGCLPPWDMDQMVWSEREQLLGLGYTTTFVDSSGTVRIQRAVTSYTTTSLGTADASYRDATTPATLDYLLTELENIVAAKYSRVKLVSDGTQVGPGQAVVTPSMIKAEIVAAYRKWERLAIVENTDTFARLLVVERNEADPNRVDVLFPPDLANSLHILAVLNEFRLQYSNEELAA